MNNDTPTEITIAMMRESLSVALICDALDAIGLTAQSPNVHLTSVTTNVVLVGRCKTTRWEETFEEDSQPYELELQAVDSIAADEVFIAAANGSMRSGIWGELLSTTVQHRGCVGAIVDGAVRDIAQMTAMNFPVWAAGRSPYDSKHRQLVTDVDVPVVIGGVTFNPGDLVFADADGIVVVPQAVETEVVRSAWEKVHGENQFRQSIKDGMSAGEAFEKYGIL